MAAKVPQEHATIAVCLREIGSEPYCFIIARQGLLLAVEATERVAERVERFGIVRAKSDRSAAAFHSLVISAEAVKRIAAIVERLGIVRPQIDGLVVTL